MSFTFYLCDNVLSDVKNISEDVVPTDTIYVTKANLPYLDTRIKVFPAAIKTVAGTSVVIQGKDFYDLKPLTMEETAAHMGYLRNVKE